jgi:hypothetical protein
MPPQYSLNTFIKHGKYEEAEKTARPVMVWMNAQPHIEKASLQALSFRRIIARTLWFQGPTSRAEANALIVGIHELVKGMGESKFEV